MIFRFKFYNFFYLKFYYYYSFINLYFFMEKILKLNIIIVIIYRMKYCKECNNILTYKNEGTELFLLCQTCNKQYKSNDYLIYHRRFNKINMNVINQNIVYDCRLPRTNKIKCLNKDCETNKKSKETEIIIYNNPVNMVSSYICSNCKYIWSN